MDLSMPEVHVNPMWLLRSLKLNMFASIAELKSDWSQDVSQHLSPKSAEHYSYEMINAVWLITFEFA